MILQRTLDLYMKYCHSRQLRPKTMISYEQTLKLFFAWLEEKEGITQVEAIKDKHIRDYIIDLQSRGKYTICATGFENNFPQNRRDYQRQVSNGTINNYLRNLRAYFAWLTEEEILKATPMKRIKPLPEERKPKEYIMNDELNVMEHTIYLPADKTKGRKEQTMSFSQKTAREMRHSLPVRDQYNESYYVFPVSASASGSCLLSS